MRGIRKGGGRERYMEGIRKEGGRGEVHETDQVRRYRFSNVFSLEKRHNVKKSIKYIENQQMYFFTKRVYHGLVQLFALYSIV